MIRIRISNLARTAGGQWRAILTVNGHAFDADRVHGSWEVVYHDEDNRLRRRQILPEVAAMLQERVRKIERREARGTVLA